MLASIFRSAVLCARRWQSTRRVAPAIQAVDGSVIHDDRRIRHAIMNALATVEAVNVDAAIKKAALEFDVQDIKKLIAAATVVWDGEVGPFARFERGSLAKSNTWRFSKFSTSVLAIHLLSHGFRLAARPVSTRHRQLNLRLRKNCRAATSDVLGQIDAAPEVENLFGSRCGDAVPRRVTTSPNMAHYSNKSGSPRHPGRSVRITSGPRAGQHCFRALRCSGGSRRRYPAHPRTLENGRLAHDQEQA